MTNQSNNVVHLDSYRKAKTGNSYYESYDQWSRLHQAEYEQKIQILIDEGLIASGVVKMDEFGMPHIYVTPNNSFYDVSINPEVKDP